MGKRFSSVTWLAAGLLAVTFLVTATTAVAWEPKRPVEFVVPAGTGGGADIMSRLIVPLIEKYKLSPQPFFVVNRPGGAGGEGFMHIKGKKGDPHFITLTLDNLFATPAATGIPFGWKDLTPVARLALDWFNLWVHVDTPYKTAPEYLKAVKEKPGVFKMAGTGTAQEDQILTVMLEQMLGLKFIYVPFKGGGDVAVSLVGKHVDSTVNNPSEQVSHWKAGRTRPLCTFDTERIPFPGWRDIPTCKEQGVDISYLMFRGILLPPAVPKEAVDWYVALFKKVVDTPEWKKYIADNALKEAFLTGPELVKWLEEKDALTQDLMKKGGFIK